MSKEVHNYLVYMHVCKCIMYISTHTHTYKYLNSNINPVVLRHITSKMSYFFLVVENRATEKIRKNI